MTVSRALTSMTVAVALAAASMGPFAAAANAEGWRDGHRGHHITRHAPRRHWRGGRNHRRYVYSRGRRDNAGKYIAIGVGAFMLGIIAAQTHRPYYD
ncbi:MAG: hypothetical protein ACTSX8_05325 [Alphaproteobacteria bacterium]